VVLARIELARQRDEQQFTLDRARAEKLEELARRKLLDEEERARIAAGGRLERARVITEARRVRVDEELRAYRDRLGAEAAAGPASLDRLFLSEALPHLAQALARGLEGARLNVFQAGGDVLPALVGQVMGMMRSLTRPGEGESST
jgi:hypothetical protein